MFLNVAGFSGCRRVLLQNVGGNCCRKPGQNSILFEIDGPYKVDVSRSLVKGYSWLGVGVHLSKQDDTSAAGSCSLLFGAALSTKPLHFPLFSFVV